MIFFCPFCETWTFEHCSHTHTYERRKKWYANYTCGQWCWACQLNGKVKIRVILITFISWRCRLLLSHTFTCTNKVSLVTSNSHIHLWATCFHAHLWIVWLEWKIRVTEFDREHFDATFHSVQINRHLLTCQWHWMAIAVCCTLNFCSRMMKCHKKNVASWLALNSFYISIFRSVAWSPMHCCIHT